MKSNFQFLESYWPDLAQLGEAAEAYLFSDPNTCIYKLGQLGERVVLELLAYEKIKTAEETTHAERIQIAKRADLLPQNVDDILYALRKGRNDAVHSGLDSQDRAKTLLRMAHRLCCWFMEVYGDWSFKAEEYHEPEPSVPDASLLERLQAQEERLDALTQIIESMPTAASKEDAADRHEKAEEAASGIELSEEESTYLDGKQVRMEVACLPVINFALQQNGLPVIRSIRIDNNTSEDIFDARIQISASPAFCKGYRKIISIIPAKTQVEIKDVDIVMDAEYLAGLTEKVTGNLTVELSTEEKVICSENLAVSVLAFNEWHGYRIFPELLAAFVTPNHPAVSKIIARAVQFLEEWTRDPSLDAYQSKDTNRVLIQSAAVYKALQEQNIVYAEPPASFETAGQRVRLCDEVLDQKMGTCMDLTVLYASCLEAIGLNPLLVLQKGHIFAGLWLEESTFPESVQDDVSLLTKRLAEGSKVLAVVECTLFTAGKNARFDDACRAAEYELKSKDVVECFVDIRRARLSHISPLPTRIQTPDGWRVERPNAGKDQLTNAPEHVSAPIVVLDDNKQEFSKKALWERKLLDLGMRNTLLNLRLTKTMVPLLSSSLDDLEDALADGGDFSIRPRPTDWTPVNGSVGFENLHIVEGYSALLQSEFKSGRLRSALTETELNNALKALYRSAKTDMEENGANTLYLALGLLKWYETNRSTQARYAPLLLVPIEMVRKSAAEGYVIRLRDDEVQMNITLLEKLRQDFSIEINGLDPLPQDNKGVDTRRVYATIRHAIMNQKRWDVLESACLGIFSFSQFVMWNDIHNRADDLARSKVVRSLMEGHLTWQAEDMHIDGPVSEDEVLLPIPADASQLFAIESAAEGKSFVLHGPPGTGKSQTITALIANVLSEGKTVLFVAEKMAALEVVQKRLAAIGLSPFCLELHSNKAKKKDVLEQLRQASEVTKYRSSGEYEASVRRIASLRKELNEYATALHRQQKCGKTLFELINEFQSYQAAPEISGWKSAFFDGITAEKLYDLDTLVDSLVSAGRSTGHPYDHPLSAVRCTSYSQQMRRTAVEKADVYKEALDNLRAEIITLSKTLNKQPAVSFDEIGLLSYAAQCLSAFDSYPKAWVDVSDPDAYLGKLRSLAEHELNVSIYKTRLMERWTEALLEQDGQKLLDEFNQNSVKWIFGKLRGMKQLRKQLSSASKGSVSDEVLGQDLADLVAYQQEKAAAEALYHEIGKDLDFLDKGQNTDWEAVADLAEKARNTIKRARFISEDDSLRTEYGTSQKAIAQANKFLTAWSDMLRAKEEFYSLLEIQTAEGDNWIACEEKTCTKISANADRLREWILWKKIAGEACDAGLEPVVKAYGNGMEHDKVAPAYKKAMYKGLAIEAIEADDALNLFSGNDFNSKIAQFRKIDQELTELSKSEIYCRLAAKVPNFTTASVGSSETGILQRAIRSGGRGLSIRKLFEQIPNLLPKLCPCMLMSPISVAQYLDPNRTPFDLVVFDEASQLPTSKAVGALARGVNAIVVGDPKQMPPTSFFASSTTDDDHLDEEDMESILDDCLALNMPQTHLLWHYRSRHESLIAFSNSQFYDNKLYTFPSVNDRESHVHLIHVDGVFERGGKRINKAEAEAVVAELKRRCHDPACSERSVGVVTFNISQQNLIDDLLTEACKDDAQLEDWAYNSKEPLFIKNLENVQGDERDVILFSIGYGPDKDGKVSMNFGPLNREGGWRRLNVAVSRARYEMIVYATLTPDQINLSRTSAEGVAALKEFMEFAAGNHLAEPENSAGSGARNASGIADAICKALKEHGYETDRSIGESAYKIDIGVVDPSNPEKYLLGILLDGSGYEAAKTTRDRELAQINILQGLGWRVTRIWTMDWWDNSEKEIARILREIHEAEEAEGESLSPEEFSAIVGHSLEINMPKASNSKDDGSNTPPRAKTIKAISAPKTDDGVVLKGVVQNVAVEKKPVTVYRAAQLPESYMSPDDFIMPTYRHCKDVAQRIMTVLNIEGPISEPLLTRRVVQSYSITRAGSRIQQFMSGIYKSMNMNYTTQGEDRFFWKSTQNPHTYTGFRANGEGTSKRDAKEIPVQEAANAVCRALEEQFSLSHEDLIRAAANLMGISRIGSAVNALFMDGIFWAEKEGRIGKSDNGNWMLKE